MTRLEMRPSRSSNAIGLVQLWPLPETINVNVQSHFELVSLRRPMAASTDAWSCTSTSTPQLSTPSRH